MTSAALAQVPAPPAAPPEPDQPVIRQNTVNPDTPMKSNLEFPAGMTGDIIADLYSTWTGKRVIVSKAAMGVDISFKPKAPITYGEAAALLVKTCFLEGLVFVPSGPNEVKLLPAPNVRKAGGYPMIMDAELLPDDEQLVTYVMSFDNIKPEEAMSIFTGVVSQVDPHGSIVPVANANALLITENSQLIRTLVQLKDRIDIPQELSMQKWFHLEHADAEETAESVRGILEFSAQQNTPLSAGGGNTISVAVNNNGGGNQGGNNRGGNNNGSNRGGNNTQRANSTSSSTVQVISDARTNRIFVIGRPIDVEVAEGLISGFDSPLSKRNYFKHKLNFLSVSDFMSIAENAISQVSPQAESSGAGGTTTRGGEVVRNAGTNNESVGGGTGISLDPTTRKEGPEAMIIGKTLLVADNSNNTIIIQGPPQAIKVVQDLIEAMDVPSEQVQITAIFGRYNLGDSLDFGVDFARTYQETRGANSGFAGQNNTGYPILVDPTTLTDIGQFASGVSGLSLYGQIGKHFTATLRAMEDSGKFHLMARPTVFTTNNKVATLNSGQQVAVPTNTFTAGGTGDNSTQSTNIGYRDVLLELEVIPLVNSANEVTLQIAFTNKNIIGEDIIDGNSIPRIGQEEIKTTVTVPNGETIVLGGLITERSESSESGIPILMHIPGLKRLFSTIQEDIVREELLIFIQPRIVSDRASLMELQSLNAEKSQLAKDIQTKASILPPKYGDPDEQEGVSRAVMERPWYLPEPRVIQLPPSNDNGKPARKNNEYRGVRR